MNLDIASLFPDLEALTPDGRWTLLQEWLRENPKYAKKIDQWVNQSPDDVFTELCDEHGKLPARVVKAIVGVEMTQKILSAIATMQACYRERANHDDNNDNSKPTSRRRKGKLHAETKKTN
jgi:hypothetical protein